MDLEDLERAAQQGSRRKPGALFPAAGSGASNDGNKALRKAVRWAAGALDKIQVGSQPVARIGLDQCGCWGRNKVRRRTSREESTWTSFRYAAPTATA